MARRPLLAIDAQVPPPSRQPSGHGHNPAQGYGTILPEGSSNLRASPERYRRDSLLDRVPEETALDEGEDELEAQEWDLAEQGFYSGSYKRTVALYGLVPVTTIVVFLFLANLPRLVWPIQHPDSPTLPRSFPSPLPELLLSAAFWSLTHLLRVPLYNLASTLCPRVFDTILFNALYVLLSQLLRLAALAALRVRHEMAYPRPTWRDGAFRTVWWLALGWGLAEAATSIAQGYEQLALYRNVMVPVERVREILAQTQWGTGSVAGSGNGSREYMPLSPRSEGADPAANATAQTQNANANGSADANGSGSPSKRRKEPVSLEEALRMAVDQDVEQLIHLQEREELEEVYGLPVVYIPVFVPCLLRIDSFLFSLGFTLILAWAYLLSPLSFPPSSPDSPLPPIYSNHPLAVMFPLMCVAHLFLSLLHSPPILPKVGVHTAAYVGLLVGLGMFFTGLGLWRALS
ncbi:hypothetical protein L227DRAFT_584495 [Lentinus tigrinus ALCF2SS1-6]|uniref:Uncharacterized protein n=1 Tax=Lentinus tigrinus ALCF2SS1-6 TaxID=1328759 RepID=A0A5C2SID2_9APHY|nr:hypothetical protein L227DRAFT_584495 [Lentinus tigrinus ALCF2SS1-6]